MTTAIKKNCSPHGATHWHPACCWATESFLKYENGQWYIWYPVGLTSDGNGEWLETEYPEWTGQAKSI